MTEGKRKTYYLKERTATWVDWYKKVEAFDEADALRAVAEGEAEELGFNLHDNLDGHGDEVAVLADAPRITYPN